MKKPSTTKILSFIISLWIGKVFLTSLPYKFGNHPDTQHIFGTIGSWMEGILGTKIGSFFSNFGAIGVGVAELIVSLILIIAMGATLLKKSWSHCCFALGGILASGVMGGAVFFHLFSPLGIEVLHQGKSDGGSLFYAALSILILGIVLCCLNYKACKK